MTRHVLSHGGHYLAAIALCLLSVRPLASAAWCRRAPGLAIVAWQALLATVWLSLIGLALSIAVAPYAKGELAGLLVLVTNRDGLPSAPQWIALVIAAALTAAAVVAVLAHAVRSLRARRRHRAALDLVARVGEHGLSIVEHEAPIAYCLPGSGGRLVVSSGAVSALDEHQLLAVALHERAHARERHDLVLLPFVVLERARLPLAATARRAVGLLVELRADDHAVAVCGRAIVRQALLRFATSAPPRAALGAAVDLEARLQRLQQPVAPARRWHVAAVVAVVVTVATTPLSLFVYPV